MTESGQGEESARRTFGFDLEGAAVGGGGGGDVGAGRERGDGGRGRVHGRAVVVDERSWCPRPDGSGGVARLGDGHEDVVVVAARVASLGVGVDVGGIAGSAEISSQGHGPHGRSVDGWRGSIVPHIRERVSHEWRARARATCACRAAC